MSRTESAILAFPILLGTLLWLIVGIASGRTILAFVLLGNLARFHRIGCLKVSFLLKGVLKPLLFGSLLLVFRFQTLQVIQEGFNGYHAVVLILLIKLILH
jgi:small-conductance mechanosensitive channel